LSNTGDIAGTEVAQVYVTLPGASGEHFKRLAGWQRVKLMPGESQTISIPINSQYISIFDPAADGWKLLPGEYKIAVGTASDAISLDGSLSIH
jgi:beta-glucosidase